MAKQVDNQCNLFLDFIAGQASESNAYYTEDIFKLELGYFSLWVMMRKGIIDEKEYNQLKDEFMEFRNKALIEEINSKS
jgi:hypothetical protein